MTNKTEFSVYNNNETVAQSFYKDLVTGTMVAFCVYISQSSTWWTFVTGLWKDCRAVQEQPKEVPNKTGFAGVGRYPVIA